MLVEHSGKKPKKHVNCKMPKINLKCFCIKCIESVLFLAPQGAHKAFPVYYFWKSHRSSITSWWSKPLDTALHCTMHYALCTALCTKHYALHYTLHYALCTIHCTTNNTMHCTIHCTMHCALCTMHYTLHYEQHYALQAALHHPTHPRCGGFLSRKFWKGTRELICKKLSHLELVEVDWFGVYFSCAFHICSNCFI